MSKIKIGGPKADCSENFEEDTGIKISESATGKVYGMKECTIVNRNFYFFL